MKRFLPLAAVLVLVPAEARTTTEILPQEYTVASPSGRYCLKVEPLWIEDWGMRTALSLRKGCGKKARRIYRELAVNYRAPLEVVVADDGTVVTLGDRELRYLPWCKPAPLVVYSPAGKVLRHLQLQAFLEPGELKKTPRAHWRYEAEAPWVFPHRVEVTTRWGGLVIIDLASGDITRGPDRFAHLRALMAGDLAKLVRVEYEGRSQQEHLRCTWETDRSSCLRMDAAWKASPAATRPLPRAQLRAKLGATGAIEQLVAAINPGGRLCPVESEVPGKPPTLDFESRWLRRCPNTAGNRRDRDDCCAERAQLLRLVFRNGAGQTVYDLEIEQDDQRQPEVVRQALRALLVVFGFDGGGNPDEPRSDPAAR